MPDIDPIQHVTKIVLPDPPDGWTYEVMDHDSAIVKRTAPDGTVDYPRAPELPGFTYDAQTTQD